MSLIQMSLAQLAKDAESACKSQQVTPQLDAICVAISDVQHDLQKFRVGIMDDPAAFEEAAGHPVKEPLPKLTKPQDEDLGSLDPKKACAIDNPDCESCQ